MINEESIKNFNKVQKRRKAIKPAYIIVLGFFVVIMVGGFLLSIPISSQSREWTNFIDALFMSFSAVCVTGLSVLPLAMHFSVFGEVVILLLIQIGGLGFMTIATIIMIILRKKILYKDRHIIRESLNEDSNKGIIKLVIKIIIMTFVVEGIGALILMPVFCIDNGSVGVWQAIFTSISAFCNSGFDIFAVSGSEYISLGNYVSNPLVSLTVAFLIIIGGLGFAVIMDLFNKKFNFKKLYLQSKIVLIVTAVLIFGGTIFFFASEFSNPLTLGTESVPTKMLASFFQSVVCRTAGFSTIDQNYLLSSSKLFSSFLMFIGASPGSTGGGIKTTTIAILIFTVVSGLKNKNSVVSFKHSLNYKTIYKAISIFILGLLIVLFLTMFLLVSEQNNPAIPEGLFSLSNVLFDSCSAFSTSGLSTGLIPYLSTSGKLAVMFTMFLGRVGLMNFGILFVGSDESELVTYPEGRISVG